MKFKTCLALIAAAGALSACTNFGGSSRPVPAVATRNPVAPTSIEGNWADPNNGFISTFQAGTFTTRTTDSNQVLASGSYSSVSPGLVEINMTSLLRKTQSKVNCAMVNPYQLNCTSDSGTQFSLARR
jgi:hypothetical protein